MNREKLREIIQMFLCTTRGYELESKMQKLLDDIELEHRKAIRPFCVSLAEIGVGIIQDAKDVVWVSNSETAIDRIFNELALDYDAREGEPLKQLKDFVKVGDKYLWQEKLREKKSEQPVQLELSPQNET